MVYDILCSKGQKELKFSKIDSQDNIKFKFIDKTKNIKEEVTNSINKLEIKEEQAFIKDANEIENVDNDGKVNWVIRIGTFEKGRKRLKATIRFKRYQAQIFYFKNKKSREAYVCGKCWPVLYS